MLTLISLTRIRWLQLFWWKLDENRLNGIVDIQSFCFPGDTFSTWKIETKLSGNLHLCQTVFLNNSSTLIIIHKQFLNWLNSFLRKLCFHSTWKSLKRKQIFWRKEINLYCPCILDWGSVGILRPSLAVCETGWPNVKKRKKEIMYREVKQNGWYLLCKLTIITRNVSVQY